VEVVLTELKRESMEPRRGRPHRVWMAEECRCDGELWRISMQPFLRETQMGKGRQHRERERGAQAYSQQLRALRERWPLAFPVQDQDVRPLAEDAARQIAATMGWSASYTHGVLRPWKQTASYCRAVLSHDQRITLDGAPAEMVDADARDLAAKELAKKKAA
jgi:ProQ/FINO family